MFKKLIPPEDVYEAPLPARQFGWYMVLFHLLAFGSWIGALAMTLKMALSSFTWREGVVIFLILLQASVYLFWLLSKPGKEIFHQSVGLYFGISLSICLVEIWLIPDLYWLLFMYMGQMFGMLPLRYAIGTTLALSVLIFFILSGWRPADLSQRELLGALGQIAAIVLMLVYIGHLNQASKERGKLIAQLEEAKARLEAAQKQEAELAVLRERERLARDLHDSLGHALVALSVQFEAIQRLYPVDPLKASVQIDEMKILVRACMEELRRSLAGLRAPGLGDRKLCDALQQLCVEFSERARVEVSCQMDEKANHLGAAVTEALWRVTLEALTNVEKHAQAHSVGVTLTSEPGSVNLQIVDDGVGFPPGAENQPMHFGLRGMRERAISLGGSLTAASKAGNESGTIIEMRLPVIHQNTQSIREEANDA
jgi:signal transduction histidine kinase